VQSQLLEKEQDSSGLVEKQKASVEVGVMEVELTEHVIRKFMETII